jgi:hypothetical protein
LVVSSVEPWKIDVIIIPVKSSLGKYLYPCIAGILIEAIVLFVVLVDNFRATSALAESIYTFFGNNAVLQNIYDFFVEWAVIICIIPIFVILVLLFVDIRRHRRIHTLRRIHDWAQNAVLILADYRKRDDRLRDSPLIRHESVKVLINALKQHNRNVLPNVKIIGGELQVKTQKAVRSLHEIDEKVEKRDDTAYDDLRGLQHELADIMMATFDYLQNT